MVLSQKDGSCTDCRHASIPKGANFCPNCGATLTMKATNVEGDASLDYVPTVDAVRIDDSVYSTPSTNPAVTPTVASTASAPSIEHSDAFPVPATHSASPATACANTDLANVQSAIYFKSPTKAMIEQSKQSQKASTGIMFIRTATDSFQGKFTVAKNIIAGHIMSGDTIDLSLADFVHPVTRIKAVAIMGSVRVVVPRGVRVQTTGVGILGEFRGSKKIQSVNAGQDAPLVILEGCAIMGAADVRINEKVPPVLVV